MDWEIDISCLVVLSHRGICAVVLSAYTYRDLFLPGMKKILARLAQGDSDEGFASYNNLGNHQGPHLAAVGRNFRVGSFTLVVESVIAEGRTLIFRLF